MYIDEVYILLQYYIVFYCVVYVYKTKKLYEYKKTFIVYMWVGRPTPHKKNNWKKIIKQ